MSRRPFYSTKPQLTRSERQLLGFFTTQPIKEMKCGQTSAFNNMEELKTKKIQCFYREARLRGIQKPIQN